MKKGTVYIMHLSHKNGRAILNAGDEVTENDVNNFDNLVKEGKIIPDSETKKAYKSVEQKNIDAATVAENEKNEKLAESKKANESAQEVIKQKDVEITTLKKEVENKTEALTKVVDLEKKVGETSAKLVDSEKVKTEALTKVVDLEKQIATLVAEIAKVKKTIPKA